jgi:hypothetical protein
MAIYSAIVLICLVSVQPQDCDEKTALDVISIKVSSELGCAVGWQEIIARSSLREGLGKETYLKTVCRINRQGTPPAGR